MSRSLLSLTTVLLAAIPAALSYSQALLAAEPPVNLETPQQKTALITFKTHAEELCRVLYLRPDAALTCVQRVLDAALPLDLAPVVTPTTSGARPIESRGSTVAPDGRE